MAVLAVAAPAAAPTPVRRPVLSIGPTPNTVPAGDGPVNPKTEPTCTKLGDPVESSRSRLETPTPPVPSYREYFEVNVSPRPGALPTTSVRSTLPRNSRFELDGAAINAADHRGVAGNVTEFDGTLGLIIGAGGGSLTLFDAVRNHGGDPANYCEIGGNPSVNKVANLTKLILSKPGVKKVAVMMNVVSNTRVDMVARGVIKGVIESGGDPADKVAIFRIPGSWEQEAKELLAVEGIEALGREVSLDEAARRAVERSTHRVA